MVVFLLDHLPLNSNSCFPIYRKQVRPGFVVIIESQHGNYVKA